MKADIVILILLAISILIPITHVDASPTTSISSLSYPQEAVQGQFSISYTITYAAQGYLPFVIRTGVSDEPNPVSSLGGGVGNEFPSSNPDDCIQNMGQFWGICFLQPGSSTGLESVTVTVNPTTDIIPLTPGRHTLTAFAIIAKVAPNGEADYIQSSGSYVVFSVTVV